MSEIAQPHILSLKPYVAGRAIGNNINVSLWAKLASNENCFGPSPLAVEAARKSLLKSHLYPNAHRAEVVKKICEHNKDFNLKPEQVALGNGSSELIINLVRGLVGPDESVLYGWPSFTMYQVAAQTHNRKEVRVPLKEDFSYDLPEILRAAHDPELKLIFLGNPNNPTGQYLDKHLLKDFARKLPPDVVLIIDEAYFDYVVEDNYETSLGLALSRPRTLVLRTFSKAYGLAGMRLGYAMGDSKIIDILCRIRDPFNVNCMVQHAAIEALSDREHVEKSVRHNLEFRPKLAGGLEELGFLVTGKSGNFVMATKSAYMPDIPILCEKLFARGVIIRPLDAYQLPESVRISVGTKEEIALLFESLKAILW